MTTASAVTVRGIVRGGIAVRRSRRIRAVSGLAQSGSTLAALLVVVGIAALLSAVVLTVLATRWDQAASNALAVGVFGLEAGVCLRVTSASWAMLAEGLVGIRLPTLRWLSAFALVLLTAAAGLLLFWITAFISLLFLL